MKTINAEQRGQIIANMSNELRDGRCALINGRVLDVTSVDDQHIVSVYDVSDQHYYNLSDDSYNYPAEELESCWVFEDEKAAEQHFIGLITQSLILK